MDLNERQPVTQESSPLHQDGATANAQRLARFSQEPFREVAQQLVVIFNRWQWDLTIAGQLTNWFSHPEDGRIEAQVIVELASIAMSPQAPTVEVLRQKVTEKFAEEKGKDAAISRLTAEHVQQIATELGCRQILPTRDQAIQANHQQPQQQQQQLSPHGNVMIGSQDQATFGQVQSTGTIVHQHAAQYQGYQGFQGMQMVPAFQMIMVQPQHLPQDPTHAAQERQNLTTRLVPMVMARMEPQIRAMVDTYVANQTETGRVDLQTELTASMDARIDAKLAEEVAERRTNVQDSMENAKTEMIAEITAKINEQLQESISDTVEQESTKKVEATVLKELSDNIKNEVKRELKETLLDSIKEAVKRESDSRPEHRLGPGFKEKLYDDLKKDLTASLSEHPAAGQTSPGNDSAGTNNTLPVQQTSASTIMQEPVAVYQATPTTPAARPETSMSSKRGNPDRNTTSHEQKRTKRVSFSNQGGDRRESVTTLQRSTGNDHYNRSAHLSSEISWAFRMGCSVRQTWRDQNLSCVTSGSGVKTLKVGQNIIVDVKDIDRVFLYADWIYIVIRSANNQTVLFTGIDLTDVSRELSASKVVVHKCSRNVMRQKRIEHLEKMTNPPVMNALP